MIKKILLLLILVPNISFAGSMKMIGEEGNMSEVSKVIEVKMYDNYYEPSEFKINKNKL